MAETVLSMARSMLGSAISKAAAAAAEEMSLLMGVQKEIWFMKDELETMQAFLVAPEVTKKKDKLVKVWAKQVRDVSYDIEDCLDEFRVHVGSQRLSRQLMKLKDRHRIAIQIRSLKSRVEEVSSRNARYNLIKTEASNTTDDTESYMEDIRNHLARNIDEAQLVGFATPKQKLIEMINEQHVDDGHVRVICVVGMGGLGKTTLARKTYESKEDIAKKFTCCAWITVSQSFSRTEMLKDMINQLLGNEALKKLFKELEGKTVQVEDLASYLRKGLNDKRYFIVLDDLWNIHDWEWISSMAFPSDNNKGSRIIVTTREKGVAEACTTEPFIYCLKPLEEKYAIDLLLRNMNKNKEDMENDENLKNIVTKLVKKCGCLPLAILTIGAMFASKHASEWEKLYNQLPSELESSPTLKAMRRMVALSYNHLPSHLKPCFLYLSIFPEDFEIERRVLVQRWIAEGFVRARVGMTFEDVAKSYFNELVKRSMIQPSTLNIEGHVKSCRVHDIVRDIIVSVSREESFVYSPRDNVPSIVEQNFRHVAYHGGNNYAPTGMDWSRVRSLTFFGERPMEPAPSLCSPQFRMLRTLDLQNAQFSITQKEMNNIGLLCHLKYLNVRPPPGYGCSNIYKVPRSIGKLMGLQTLDIRRSHISTLPAEISKLQSLRSLRCSKSTYYGSFHLDDPKKCLMHTLRMPMMFTPLFDSEKRDTAVAKLYMACSSRWSKTYGVRIPAGISKLKELQILEVVDIKRTNSKAIQELGELSELRKLRVITEGATGKKCKTLCEAINKLSSLRSLAVDADGGSDTGTPEWLRSDFSPPPLLRSLHLSGYIGEMPDWFSNLRQLVKIRLGGSKLKEGKTMDTLGALPSLLLLNLYGNAYVGKELVFSEGAFPCLRKLELWNLPELREMRFEESASPQMESIQIGGCRLESGIVGIRNLPRLKEIELSYGSWVARLGRLQEEVNEHPNKPVVRLQHDRSRHDLGEVEGSDAQVQATEPAPDSAGEASQAITMAPSEPVKPNSEDA